MVPIDPPPVWLRTAALCAGFSIHRLRLSRNLSHTLTRTGGSRTDASDALRRLLLVLFAGAVLTGAASAASGFSPRLAIEDNGVRHDLIYTGEAERVFLIFRIYEIAHYTEAIVEPGTAGASAAASRNVVRDGPAKALSIRFSRRLGQERVRKELEKALRRNAEAAWLQAAEPSVAGFLAAIDRDVSENDELTYYWLPGGRVFVEFNGERFYTVRDIAFAKLIWSIWFGDDPVCDRDKLLAELPSADTAP